MQEPSPVDLEFDVEGTRKIRRGMARAKVVKITINIDADSLAVLRSRSVRTGVPYQRLLNQLLRRALRRDTETESRLDRLEKELKRIKRALVA